MIMLNLLVDCDAGSDDAWALMMLLAWESVPTLSRPYKVVAVTCTHGNTDVDNVCKNVFLVLESLNRNDVPVFKGSCKALLGRDVVNIHFHGKNGLGDLSLPPPSGKVENEDAVTAINKFASKGRDFAVMCLGPLTNLALALRVNPDLKNQIGELWIMGGNVTAKGNVDDTTAEFNFHQDPEAAEIVLGTIQCPTFILPWEPCIDVPITMSWRMNDMGVHDSKHISLLNKVDAALYPSASIWNPCDALLAGVFINRDIGRTRPVYMTVETNGNFTRGQGVLLHNRKPNVEVIENLDFEKLKDVFMITAAHQPH